MLTTILLCFGAFVAGLATMFLLYRHKFKTVFDLQDTNTGIHARLMADIAKIKEAVKILDVAKDKRKIKKILGQVTGE